MSVRALSKSGAHAFSKANVPALTLVAGLGVEGDCHLGEHVQHRSRLHIRPPPANLRQVHLIPREVLDPLGVGPGQIGENITTSGIDLLALGRGTRLHFLPAPTDIDQQQHDAAEQQQQHAVVVVTGLRNPCPQIDRFRPGLKEEFVERDAERRIVGRTAGVMATVEVGGPVTLDMEIVVELPLEYLKLECV